MKTTELIAKLQAILAETSQDPEVLCQASNCCRHGHSIVVVEPGQPRDLDGVDTSDEVGSIVIRV